MKPSELNVLVVEDDEFQRRMSVNMLRSIGVAWATGASNGREALEAIRVANGNPVHIALCDLNMPEMDGMAFLRHLAQEDHNVAIIIVSALDAKLLSSVVRMTRMYGIRLLGAVEKPILHGQLKELLEKYEHLPPVRAAALSPHRFTLHEVLRGVRARQFEPWFQAQVDLGTGGLVGAEALARWMHPEQGIVGPYAFVPMLEQTRQIDELTFQMIEKAAAACRVFHESGFDISVSVNLSLASLDDPALADQITRVVRRAGIEPRHLMLEITESAAMTDVAHALENLARLCMNGFPLSIDDFGTGYASLQQLTRVAFSELKIDQSFVRDASESEALRIVVQSSVEMARRLRVKSVAEGVETQKDWDAVKSVGCDTAQGYFIARPMAHDAFLAFCEAHSAR